MFHSQNYHNPVFFLQNYYSLSSLEWISIILCLGPHCKDTRWIWICKILPQNQMTVYCLDLLRLRVFTLFWALCPFLFQHQHPGCSYLKQPHIQAHTWAYIMEAEIYLGHTHSFSWSGGLGACMTCRASIKDQYVGASSKSHGSAEAPLLTRDILPRMGDHCIGSLVCHVGRQLERSECDSFRHVSINKISVDHAGVTFCSFLLWTCIGRIVTMVMTTYITLFT